LPLGSNAFGVDTQPVLHRAAAHLEWPSMRLADQGFGVLGSNAHHQAALTAGRDRHVPADEKGQPSEHPLLGDV